MIRLGAPRLIHSDAELAEYTDALFELTAKANPTPEEEEAIDLMTLLVERYEAGRYPVPEAEPVDVLKFLLDQNSLSQRDISKELGSESTVSLILSGKRQLNRDHIARLSQRFNVSPAVFFGPSMPLHEAMRIVLSEKASRTATTQEISEEIARRELYERKDGDAAPTQQINARARNYPALFEFVQPSQIRLR
jgi:HTH-type transcriptional regulator/antitoxin HigA